MARRLRPPITPKLEGDAERVRRNHEDRIAELQAIPWLRGKLIRDVVLVANTEVKVHHGLGHLASLWPCIPIQLVTGAATGRLMDITLLRATEVDPNTTSVLLATGFTVDLRVDLWAL